VFCVLPLASGGGGTVYFNVLFAKVILEGINKTKDIGINP